MPTPKRWFHCSRDINDDAEVWELTTKFGDRSIRLWLEILSITDRCENHWRLSGEWLAGLSRKVRQTPASVRLALDWMLAKGWLQVAERAADGSPTVLSTPNYSKYHKTAERKNEVLDSGSGPDRGSLLTFPFLNKNKREEGNPPSGEVSAPQNLTESKPIKSKRSMLADAEFIAELKKNPAYRHIDIDREFGKMDAWLLTPRGQHRKKTRAFAVNWLNRIEAPMGASPQPKREVVL